MGLGSISLNMVWNPAIKGSNFLQASIKGIHTYAKTVTKANLLQATKFPILNRNLKQLKNHLGHIRTQTAKISANPIRLDIKTSGASLKEARKDMTAIQHDAKQVAFWTKKTSENLRAGARVSRVGRAKTALRNKARIGAGIATAGVVGAVVSLNPVRKAIDFESSMADITKATNATKVQTLKLKTNIITQVNKGSLLTPKQIADIQAGGGRSGVAIKALPSFTVDIAKASVAMDLMTEESGRQFAKMAERMNLPISKISIMTNAFTHLENNGANSARDLISTTGRLAGIYKELDFKPKNSAALSNYMNTLEVSPELAATSFKILVNRLKKTNSEFGYFDTLKAKGASGLKGIIKDITSKMDAQKIIKTFGSQGANVITKMSLDTKNLDKSLDLMKDGSFMNAVENEYKIKIATTGAKEIMAQNRITAQSILLGDELKHMYVDMYNHLSNITASTVSFYKENKELVNTLVSVAFKVGVVALGIKAISMIASPFVSLITGVWKFRNQIKTGAVFAYKMALGSLGFVAKIAGGALKFVARSVLWLGRALLLNPIGLTITAIAGAGYLIYKNWDYLKKNVGAIWNNITAKIKKPFVLLFDWIDNKFKKIMAIVNKVKSIGSNINKAVKAKASKVWSNTKNFFGFGNKENKQKITKPILLKSLPVNNSNFKKETDHVSSKKTILHNKTEKNIITKSVTAPGPKNFFGFGNKENKQKITKPILLKSLPTNNIDFKKETDHISVKKTILHNKTEKNIINKTVTAPGPKLKIIKPTLFKTVTQLQSNKLAQVSSKKMMPQGTKLNFSSLKEMEIPKLPLKSVSEMTTQTLQEQKNQIQGKSVNKQITQHITNTIHIVSQNGEIDEEELYQKLISVQRRIASEETDIDMEDSA